MAKLNLKNQASAIAVLVNCLIKYGKEERGDSRFADILDPDLLERLKPTGIQDIVRQIGAEDQASATELFESARVKLSQLLLNLSTRDLEIAIERIFNEGSRSRTLDHLGNQFQVTRERVRQIQNSVERKISNALGDELRLLAFLTKLEAGGIVLTADLEKQLRSLFPGEGADYNGDRTRHLVRTEMRYKKRHGVMLSAQAFESAIQLGKDAKKLSDRVGLVDEVALKATLGDSMWLGSWNLLCKAGGLEYFSNHLGLRATGVARVKAAILNLGRPATIDEISKESGIEGDKLVRTIITNNIYFVRADKKRWTLRENVSTVYRGISSMIKQRIEEEGGETSLQRLIDELPEMYGVKKISVSAYARTMQYVINDDRIRVANLDEIQLRNLDDIISGRDSRGYPYWSFKIAPQYFKGYSILGVPPEFAQAMGCEPNGKRNVEIVSPLGCKPLSLIWRLDSTTGASLGYFRNPMLALRMAAGDTAHIVILPNKQIEIRTTIS